MWARICELVIGAWLLASPFVLGHADHQVRLANDVVSGAIIVLLAGLSWVPRLRRAHLGSLVVAAWLIVWGWILSAPPASAAAQLELLLGLLLAMIAIVPTEASRPPVAWRRA